MIIVCAWHGGILGRIKPLDDGKISHGICIRCREKVEAEYQRVTGRKLREEEHAETT